MKRNSKMPGILLFGFIIQLIANIFPDAVIQIRLTTDANIADSVQEMKGKCIRALAVHVNLT